MKFSVSNGEINKAIQIMKEVATWGRSVGCIVMNHKDTYRGHLHAGIVPWHRGEGYGTKMLSLALQKCFDAGIHTVHITPRNDNKGAIKTILKNGGVLIEEFMEDGNQILRYEIDVTTSVEK